VTFLAYLRAHRLRLIGATLVTAVAAYLLIKDVTSGTILNNHYDDAYITYRYAIQLARGHGLVFNVGERTDAASSFSFTVLLSALYRLGLHRLESVSTCIGVASAALTAAVVFYTSAGATRRWLAPVGMGLFSAYHGFISGWAGSGMETCFYALVVTVVVARFFVCERDDGWTVALVCLAALTRVEGVLLAAGWLLTGLLQCADPAARRRFLLHAGSFFVVVGAFYTFKAAYYGTPLPHSFLFKRVALWYQPNREELVDRWTKYGAFVSLAAVGGLACLPRPRSSIGLGAFLLLSAVSIARGPWSGEVRYSVHLLPTLALLGALALERLRLTLWPLAFGLAFFLYLEATSSFGHMQEWEQWYSGHQVCRHQAGEYVARNAPAGAVVLSSDLGSIAYQAIDHSFIDMIGLTSADVLGRYLVRENADEILEAKRPTFVADSLKTGKYNAIQFVGGGATNEKIRPSSLGGRLVVGTMGFSCTAPDGTVIAAGSMMVK
jgi:arabinofuranosyltransferase